MSKLRDSKGTFIATKIPENLYGPRKIPSINSVDRYAGKIFRGESSEEVIEDVVKDPEAKATMQFGNISQQVVGEVVATQSEEEIRKEPKIVVEEVEFAVGVVHKILENLNIPTNPVVEPSPSGETSPATYKVSFRNMADEEGNEKTETETFGFPILDITRNVTVKNISLSSLPHFHGMSYEDPDSFLFEFDILCRSYIYTDNAKKLKLFPATLKDLALRWFMSLGEHGILSWDDMKTTFLQKYQDYCIPRYYRNDIFKMQQSEEEILEDYL